MSQQPVPNIQNGQNVGNNQVPIANPPLMQQNQIPVNPQMMQMIPQFQPINMAPMQGQMPMNPMMMQQNFMVNPQTGQMMAPMPGYQMVPMQMVNFGQAQNIPIQPVVPQFMPAMGQVPNPGVAQQTMQQQVVTQGQPVTPQNGNMAPQTGVNLPFQQVFQPMPMGQVPNYMPLNAPVQQFLTPSNATPNPKPDDKMVPQDYGKKRKHKIRKVSRARNHINYSDLHDMDIDDEELERRAMERKAQHSKKPKKEPKGGPKDTMEEQKGKLSIGGLINPKFVSEEEIKKWLNARRKNYPTRKNIEEKRLRQERGEEEGELNEEELSQLELKLRKKIMILTSDPREERRRQKEMRFLFRNLTCIKKRRPQRNQQRQAEKGQGLNKGKKVKNEPEIAENTPVEEKQEKLGKNSKASRSSSDNEAPPQEVKIVKDEPVERIEPTRAVKVPHYTKNEPNEPENAENVKKVTFAENDQKQTPSKPGTAPNTQKTSDRKARPPKKSHTYQEIIQHLSQRRDEDEAMIENFLSEKPNSDRFRYQQNTLLTSLLIDEVYSERSTMLKVLRYLRKNNFMQPVEPENMEEIPKSDQIEQ